MIFQEPMSSLNPCYPVGWQIGEALRAHHAVPRRERARRASIELLDQVGIPGAGDAAAARSRTSFPAA